jgi:WD40 repeat protein
VLSETRTQQTGIFSIRFQTVPFMRGGASPSAEKIAPISQVLAEDANVLIIGTTTGIGILNTRTLKVEDHFELGRELLRRDGSGTTTVPVGGGFSFAPLCHSGDVLQLNCAVATAFSPEVIMLSIGLRKSIGRFSRAGGVAAGESEIVLAMLASVPLVEDSPLHATMNLVSKLDSTSTGGANILSKGDRAATKKLSLGTTNSPVTFGRSIKSSGYGSASSAPRQMFQPHVGKAKKKKAILLKGAKSGSGGGGTSVDESYPINCDPPASLVFTLGGDASARALPGVTQLRICHSGKAIAIAANDKTILSSRLPFSSKAGAEPKPFGGPGSSAVQSMSWSRDDKILMTSSANGIVEVWDTARVVRDPLLVANRCVHNFKVDKKGDPPNTPFGKGKVVDAQFYYMDKFILLAAGSELRLYKYSLDFSVNDLKRYQRKSKYRLVTSLGHGALQSVTALAAPNTFYSYHAITAGSDKSVTVFDMNTAQPARVIQDAHARPAHAVCVNTGSKFASHPPDAYNIFLTTSQSDGIAMWDLRANRCVRRFSEHASRAHAVGVDFSPCGRFIATGSEDKCAYLYDIRSGTYLHKLVGHTDVVSDVAFHPLSPQLLTASLDGKIRVFSSMKLGGGAAKSDSTRK